jgi:hypothetical protein
MISQYFTQRYSAPFALHTAMPKLICMNYIAGVIALLAAMACITVAQDSRSGAIAFLIIAILACYYLYVCVVAE